MLDIQWVAGKSFDEDDIFLVCPKCGDKGVYYETMIQGQACVHCNREFEGVVVTRLRVVVRV